MNFHNVKTNNATAAKKTLIAASVLEEDPMHSDSFSAYY